MKIYHTAQSRSMRVLWLLEELGLDYELTMLPFDPKALTLADHLDVDDLGELPVLIDGGTSMARSTEILRYLADRYDDGRLMPDRASADYGPCLEWIEFAEDELMDPLSQWLQHTQFLPETERDTGSASRARSAFERFARVVDARLAGKAYLLGEAFSVADIAVGHALFVAEQYAALPSDCANLAGYYDRLRARPAFQVAATR